MIFSVFPLLQVSKSVYLQFVTWLFPCAKNAGIHSGLQSTN